MAAAGDSMLAFALIWTATGHGPTAVALTSTLAVLPRILLLLVGGALGDRFGPRRFLIIANSLQLAVLVVLSVVFTAAPGVVFLAVAAGATGVISAFQQPSAVVLPRLLISHERQLPRALARVSGSQQIARILGVGAGGAAAASLPLFLVTAANAAAVALGLVVLCMIRVPGGSRRAPRESQRAGIWGALAAGVRSARALGLLPLLAAVALVCAAVLPTVAVVLPSLARANGWSAAQAGLLDIGWAVGMLAVTLLVSYFGTLARRRCALVGGPAVVCLALAVLALPLTFPMAVALFLLTGAGTALFTTHVAPMVLQAAPVGQLARFQSLLAIVQLAPPVLLNSPLAALSGSGRSSTAFLFAALLAGGGALAVIYGARSRRGRKRAAEPPAEPTASPQPVIRRAVEGSPGRVTSQSGNGHGPRCLAP